MKNLLLGAAFVLSLGSMAKAADEFINQEGLVPADELAVQVQSNVDEWRRNYVCYSRNARGDRFTGYGRTPQEAQEAARRACRIDISIVCTDEGCRDY